MVKTDRKPAFSGVQKAYEKIAAKVPATPIRQLIHNDSILWCKCESEQPIGAFKLRGAWHRLTDLSEGERAAGVVAFSSGNHAQGVAWAARELGIAAAIVMPADAPRLKLKATKALGAEVILYDRAAGEDRVAIARNVAQRRGATLVPSFDDPWVIEGQGSCGLEIVAQMGRAPDIIVTPCGGGGLGAGLALACPEAEIVLVEPEGWDDMAQSLALGEIVPVGPNAPHTVCDALQTPKVSPLTFDVLHARGAKALSVSDDEVFTAMRYIHHHLGVIIEPGGATAMAALLAGKIKPLGTCVVILSGSNVDPEMFKMALKLP
jgi:threonine dehydratase